MISLLNPLMPTGSFTSLQMLWPICHDLAKRLSHYLYFFFFSFLIGLTTTRWSMGKYHVTLSQCHNWYNGWSQMVISQVIVTVCHMTRVTWGPWKSKCIAIVVKCISSRELSENSIEFSLSNSEQRDSWLNSGHQTLDADTSPTFFLPTPVYPRPFTLPISSNLPTHSESLSLSPLLTPPKR